MRRANRRNKYCGATASRASDPDNFVCVQISARVVIRCREQERQLFVDKLLHDADLEAILPGYGRSLLFQVGVVCIRFV